MTLRVGRLLPGQERTPDGAGNCSDLIVVGCANERHRNLPHS